jgi:hypothetical protein
MVLSLTFSESVQLELYKAIFTAVFVAGAAALVVRYYQDKSAARQSEVEAQRADLLKQRDDARARADKERDDARARADRERELMMAASRANRTTQYDFVTRTSELAGSFYFATQQYSRRKRDQQTWGQLNGPELDQLYTQWAANSEVLETELRIRYGREQGPAETWHQVRDLLTVRYFDLRDRNTEALRAVNALGKDGKKHSGLPVDDLNDMNLVLRTYSTAMSELAMHLQQDEILF